MAYRRNVRNVKFDFLGQDGQWHRVEGALTQADIVRALRSVKPGSKMTVTVELQKSEPLSRFLNPIMRSIWTRGLVRQLAQKNISKN